MTELQEIINHPGQSRHIRLFIKRDDLVHPEIQGNKWRKLHLLLDKLQSVQTPGIVTFGGAFSNHLHALAAAGHLFNIPTVGIVRGESADLENPTLAFAIRKGMQIIRVPKKVYDLGAASPEIAAILSQFPGFYMLPEGGSTPLGVTGCTEISREILLQLPDGESDKTLSVCIPAGTGCTAAGILVGLAGRGEVLIFPAASYGVDREIIRNHLNQAGFPDYRNFKIVNDYVFGGFARWNDTLNGYTQSFEKTNGVLLDPVYTAKMFYGIFDLLEKGFFPENSLVVGVHTGGLQGWAGFNSRYANKEI